MAREEDALAEDAAKARPQARVVWWLLAAALFAIAALVSQATYLWPIALIAAAGLSATTFLLYRLGSFEARALQSTVASEAPSLPLVSAFDLAGAVADPLIIFDRQGVVVHANPAAENAFGPLPAGTMMLLRFRAPELQRLIECAIAGISEPTALDYLERLPMERLFRLSLAPLGRQREMSVLVFRDHSEARRIDRMRADFIANASHELRTPLASITGFIETLRGPARDDVGARERFLGIMQEQTSRMARLIDDLLSLSRIEMKSLLKPGDIADLSGIVKSVVEANTLRARELGVEIEADLPAEPLRVQGDKDELFQVFENLVENACKYGQSGGRVDVSLRVADESGEMGVIAKVRDHGPGIAPEHIPRVTERFYRVEAATGKGQKGTGLGLAIVKHIVTRHNARLMIRSKIGDGTEFAVFFPEDLIRE